MKNISYSRYRFPPEIIKQAIWLYLRFSLSLRDVEDLLVERGIAASYETIRRWVNHFGPLIAADLRKRRPKPHTTWHLDEVYLKIAGRMVYCGAPSMLRARSSMCWSSRSGTSMPRARHITFARQLIIRMASENRTWGYDRIAGALANLGYEISDQTVGNVMRRHGLPPAPERKRTTTWAAFIRTHLALLAGTDFFTAEVLTLRGLVTYYVLFIIHLESRRVYVAGITVHPDEAWMKQIARNVTMDDCGALRDCRYLLHDRDTKFTRSFRAIIASGRVEPLALPARSPNLNA